MIRDSNVVYTKRLYFLFDLVVLVVLVVLVNVSISF